MEASRPYRWGIDKFGKADISAFGDNLGSCILHDSVGLNGSFLRGSCGARNGV